MRIYELLHELVMKFAPMDAPTAGKLQSDAATFYGKSRQEYETIIAKIAHVESENAKNANNPDYQPVAIPKMPLKLKVIEFLESWYCRYIIAILFIILVPKIKAYINGDEQDDDEEEEQDNGGDLAAFLEFQRFRKGMK